MTPLKLAARRAEANARIKAAANVFSEQLGVDPPAFDDIPNARKIGSDVARMREYEVLADWMEAVIEAASVGPAEAAQRRAARSGQPPQQQAEEPEQERQDSDPTVGELLAALNADVEERTPRQQEIMAWFLGQLAEHVNPRMQLDGQDVEQSAQGDQAQVSDPPPPPAAPAAEADSQPAAEPLAEPQTDQADPDGGDPEPVPGAPGDGADLPAADKPASRSTGKAGKS